MKPTIEHSFTIVKMYFHNLAGSRDFSFFSNFRSFVICHQFLSLEVINDHIFVNSESKNTR